MELHLLVLAPLDDDAKRRVEEAFDSVHYGSMPGASPTDGAPHPVEQSILERTTCVFGWELPDNVRTAADMPNLRWQMTPSAGADRLFKSTFYREPGVEGRVQLTSNSGVHCGVIPPYVLSMAFMLFARIKTDLENQIVHRKWNRQRGFYIRELGSTTFGILGYGRLGRETARLASAYGCRVIAATSDGQRRRDPECAVLCPGMGDVEAQIPAEMYSTGDETSLSTFLEQTDVLVVCLPAAKATMGMLDKARLARMKNDAILINIGRGEVVDTEALADALQARGIGGAALDVTSPEPLPQNHRLWSMENCIITPHIAGVTERYMSRSVDMLLLNARKLRAGEPLLNRIDYSKGY